MSFDWRIAAQVFGVIFIAELPDKTALASVVLATRNRALPVFLGSAAALTIQSVVAVLAGALLALLPARPVHMAAGALFIVFAVLMWRRSGDDEAPPGDRPPTGFWRTAATAFSVVFLAEWGDLTQLGTAALAARYRAPWEVFFGSTLALWAVVLIAVVVGNRAAAIFKPRITQRVAAVVFALVGIALMTGWL